MNRRILIAAFWGIAMGAITFAIGALSMRSENPVLAALQAILLVLIVPGLLGAAALARNVHAFALTCAAVINAILQFGLCSLLILIIKRSVSRRTTIEAIVIILAMAVGALVLCGMIVMGTLGIDVHLKRP